MHRGVWGAMLGTTIAALAVLLSRLQGMPAVGFVEVAPSLWRFVHRHMFAGAFGWTLECNTFLVIEGDAAILIDAGVADEPYPAHLVANIKQALGPATLKLVILTHGHVDHVGGLDAVFAQWPAVQLAYHELDHPFLTGPIDPNNVPSNYSKHNIWLYRQLPAATPERVLHLQGRKGDVSQLSSPAGLPVRWRPPAGLLTWLHVPGHAPGQVALHHKRSGMLLAGDLFYFVSVKEGQKAQLSRLPPGIDTRNPLAVQSIKQAAHLDFDRAWAAHDVSHGVPAAEFRAWAEGLSLETMPDAAVAA